MISIINLTGVEIQIFNEQSKIVGFFPPAEPFPLQVHSHIVRMEGEIPVSESSTLGLPPLILGAMYIVPTEVALLNPARQDFLYVGPAVVSGPFREVIGFMGFKQCPKLGD
jgi:hypothetical protein